MSHGLERATPHNDADNPSSNAASDHGTGIAEILKKLWESNPMDWDAATAELEAHLASRVAAARNQTLALAAELAQNHKDDINTIARENKRTFLSNSEVAHQAAAIEIRDAIRDIAPDPHFRRRLELNAAIAQCAWWQRYHGKDHNGEGLKHTADLQRELAGLGGDDGK